MNEEKIIKTKITGRDERPREVIWKKGSPSKDDSSNFCERNCKLFGKCKTMLSPDETISTFEYWCAIQEEDGDYYPEIVEPKNNNILLVDRDE